MLLFKRVLSLLLVAIMTFPFLGASPNTESKQGKYVISEIDIGADFSDCKVLIVLDKKTSLEFRTFEIEDFSEIDCVRVTNLTSETEKIAKESLEKGTIAYDDIKFNKILCLELANHGKENVLNAIEKLQQKENILSAEPDYVISVCATPNDPYYSQQWGNSMISLPSAWDATTGSSTVYVGVVDSGIDSAHSEFSGRIKTTWCKTFLSGTGVSETTPTDPYGHGTHVAGIIGAAGNNSSGVCGVCWNTKLVSLKVLNSTGYGLSSYAVAAIDYAESKKIPILNMSLRWYSNWSSYDSPMSTAINNYSGLVVCAAGNDYLNIETYTYGCYPAKYTCSNMIVVGASTNNDTKASFSNYGTISVDIFAPGVDILSTYPTAQCTSGTHNLGDHYANGYHKMDGTSMATPYVAGVAALIKSCHPNITVSQLKTAILNHGDYRSSLSGYCVTGRRLNAFSALDSTHSYTYTDYGNAMYHKCDCSICGYTVYRLHNWVEHQVHSVADGNDIRYIPEYYCSDCGAFTLNPINP